MIPIQYRQQGNQIGPGVRRFKPQSFKDIGSVKHHKKLLGGRQRITAILVLIRDHRLRQKTFNYRVETIEVAQIQQRAAAGKVNRLPTGNIKSYIGSSPGQCGLNKTTLHQTQVYRDAGFRGETVTDQVFKKLNLLSSVT